jgi:hypothetical protein
MQLQSSKIVMRHAVSALDLQHMAPVAGIWV